MADSNIATKATLNKKSIAAIADQVEARIRRAPVKEFGKQKQSEDGHGGGKKVFLLGAASGLAAAVFMPLFGRQARPVVRGAIRGVNHYNTGRPHQSLGPGVPDQVERPAPAVQDPERISSSRRVSSRSILGGLHHEYRWAVAA